MIHGAIFDVDGTLVDTMGMWNHCGERYLAARGIEAEPNLAEVMKILPIHESGHFIKKHYPLSDSPEAITDGLNAIAYDYFMNEAVLKPFIPEILSALSAYGIRMAVGTASDKEVVEPLLARLGILPYFCEIHSCKTLGLTKSTPDFFLTCAKRLDTKPSDTLVFEDMVHAATSAYQGGLTVVGMYDAENAEAEDELRRICRYFIKTEADVLSFLRAMAR
ncbi:MAG: HAD family phosphatase [Ruminococcaceae bacterium]|nr:HAD family phosphatase [Oscillospiraceae bacterium]